jgi:large subunit ribosomal protein L37Ae
MALPKELGSVKRFGTRYGRTGKHKLALIESVQRQKHKCPYCSYNRVKRLAAGIWFCTKCATEFTGRAYTLSKKKATAQELFEEVAKETKVTAEEETKEEDEEVTTYKEPQPVEAQTEQSSEVHLDKDQTEAEKAA